MNTTHDSDCAIHNMPASPIGPCDCSRSTSTDPEELRLRDIGQAAVDWREDGASAEKFHELIDAYRDHRAKASAPILKVGDVIEYQLNDGWCLGKIDGVSHGFFLIAPEDKSHLKYASFGHLRWTRESLRHPAKASAKCIACNGSGKTYPAVAGFAEPEHRGQLYTCGMCGGTGKASAPVTPRFKIGDQVLVAGTVVQAETRITYLTFDGGPQEAPFRTESIPTFASPSNPDIRVEPTDEALIRFLRRYDLEGGFYTRMLKDALAQFNASISDDQLKELRTIALTRDGVDLYLTDARLVVGR